MRSKVRINSSTGIVLGATAVLTVLRVCTDRVLLLMLY